MELYSKISCIQNQSQNIPVMNIPLQADGESNPRASSRIPCLPSGRNSITWFHCACHSGL